MSTEKRFVIKKEAKTDVITYMEYKKLKGLSVKPKNKLDFEDMINVNEMVVINPSLIKKLITKKTSRTFDKIVKMLSIIYEREDDDDDSGYGIVLDEIERFKSLLINKYKAYMEEKEYQLTIKKLELLKQEIETRNKSLIKSLEYSSNKKGKSSR